ncbi:MAG: hypothetical protein ACOY0T_27655 [Myxococcota bacterium]
MSKGALGHTVAGIGILLSFCLGILVLFRPDVVETRSRALLVAHVRREMAQEPRFTQTPVQQANIQRALADVCHHCSPQRPVFVPDDAPREIQLAIRRYIGMLLDLFVGILALLTVNLLAVVVGTLIARSQPTAWPCATAVSAAVILSEIAELIAPSPFYFVFLRWPVTFPVGWGVVLFIGGLVCAIRRSTPATRNPT